jgi:hypothetical protein
MLIRLSGKRVLTTTMIKQYRHKTTTQPVIAAFGLATIIAIAAVILLLPKKK